MKSALARRTSLAAVITLFSVHGCIGAAQTGPDTARDPDKLPVEDLPAHHPFGEQAAAYAAGAILPNHLSRAELSQRTAAFYDRWREKYLVPGCRPGHFVVRAKTKPDNLTVSEAHGYGMILAALFAGHDPAAQEHFNGMVSYLRRHPSGGDAGLMAWFQTTQCQDSRGNVSASDGDLDIAYALLLADRQWGSCGVVDYYGMAVKLLAAIQRAEVAPQAQYVLLGDWVNPGESKFFRATRPSDFVFGHFVSFARSTQPAVWNKLGDQLYRVIDELQRRYSPVAGLVPDFVLNPGGVPAPAGAFFLESEYDGHYSYNACRVPWRLGSAFLATGDARAKLLAQRFNVGMRRATNDNPADIHPGYYLSGKPVPKRDYHSMAFTAPLGVSAMVDSSNQSWLNRTWDVVEAHPLQEYYEDTLKLLAMVAMSGNWWTPESAPLACRPH